MYIVLVVQSLSHILLCNPMDCSIAGFPVLYYLPELAQIHVHCVDDVLLFYNKKTKVF